MLMSLLGASLLLPFPRESTAQDGMAINPKVVTESRDAWYRDAKLGAFIHWGLYAIPGQGEWAMFRNGIAADDYTRLSEAWKPDNGVEEKWVLEAKRMGPVTWCLQHDTMMDFRCSIQRPTPLIR